MSMLKYPRTHHLEGSRLQPGDEDLDAVPFAAIAGRPIVVEEKIDGANAALSFVDGALHLQSRGHYLTGGPRERHFALFKAWAETHRTALHATLGERFIVYGEWCYARHTVYYDRLPHYFLEFDVHDRETGAFLSTPARRALLGHLPLVPVPVLASGPASTLAALTALVGPSRYKSPRWADALDDATRALGLDPARARAETDPSPLAEGLYVKVEVGDRVLARYKWIRASFLTAVLDSGSHWLDRPIVPNQLAPDVDLFAPAPTEPAA